MRAERTMVNGALMLDSNLLLLLVVGSMDRSLIRKYARTEQFTESDFDTVLEIVANSRNLIATPHILTEVSNLANKFSGDQRRLFADIFRAVIGRIEERYKPASELSAQEFFQFGITDVSIFMEHFEQLSLKQEFLVITQDGPLVGLINAAGGTAMDLQTAINMRKNWL